MMDSDAAFAEWYAEEFGFPMEDTDPAYLGSIRSAWEHGVLFEQERQKELRRERDAARERRHQETRRRRQEYIDRGYHPDRL